MTKQSTESDAKPEAMLAEMAAAEPGPDSGLLNRVMADAEQVSAARLAPALETRTGFWSELLSALGGWGAMAGLGTAAVAGLWLGIVPPDALPDVGEWFLDDTAVSALDGLGLDFDSLLDEG